MSTLTGSPSRSSQPVLGALTLSAPKRHQNPGSLPAHGSHPLGRPAGLSSGSGWRPFAGPAHLGLCSTLRRLSRVGSRRDDAKLLPRRLAAPGGSGQGLELPRDSLQVRTGSSSPALPLNQPQRRPRAPHTCFFLCMDVRGEAARTPAPCPAACRRSSVLPWGTGGEVIPILQTRKWEWKLMRLPWDCAGSGSARCESRALDPRARFPGASGTSGPGRPLGDGGGVLLPRAALLCSFGSRAGPAGLCWALSPGRRQEGQGPEPGAECLKHGFLMPPADKLSGLGPIQVPSQAGRRQDRGHSLRSLMLAAGSSGTTPLPGEQRGGLCPEGPCGGEPGCSAVSLPHCWPRQLGLGTGENSCSFLRWLLGKWCSFRNVGRQDPVWGIRPSAGICRRNEREGKQRGAFQS